MYMEIDGVDITPYIKAGGVKWGRNDIDSDKSGRTTMDSEMHRDRISIKYRFDVTCRPLKQSETEKLLALIEPEFVEVRSISPRHGDVSWRMYSNNVPATHCMTGTDGEEYWSGISFPLIQK